MPSDLVAALQQFMNGRDWQESIETFVTANCKTFKHIETFSHQHFAVWKDFQEIVESILAVALDDMGCDLADFESAFDKLCSDSARGPREATRRDIMGQLLTYENFQSFSDMMQTAAQFDQESSETEYNRSDRNGLDDTINNKSKDSIHRDYLLGLGFSSAAIDYAISQTPIGSSVESLMDHLDKYESLKSSHKNMRGESKSYEDNASAMDDLIDNESTIEADCINALALETLQEPGELRAKFVIALSILDSANAGSNSDGILHQLAWASDMCNLFKEMVSCIRHGLSLDEGISEHGREIVPWFEELDRILSDASFLDTQGKFSSVSEAQKMIALEELAAMGTEDERLLHALLSRHEVVTNDLSRLHGKCILMTSHTSRGPDIKREHLEELYLYLKEKVNSGVDLSLISDDMYVQISQLISSEKSTDVINTLLDIHVLEDEQILLRRQIAALLKDPANLGSKTTDEKEIGDMFGSSDTNGSLFGKHINTEQDIRTINVAEGKQSEHRYADVKRLEDKEVVSKIKSNVKYYEFTDIPDIYNPNKDYRSIKQDIADKEGEADRSKEKLAALRDLHRNGLKNLQTSLQDQKARILSALERRISSKNKQIDEDESDSHGQNTRSILEGADVNSNQALDLESFTDIEEALTNGFKRRCVYETRAANENNGLLTDELLKNARLAAAEDLKQRHESDLKRLLDDLRQSQARERIRITELITARRNKNALNGARSSELQREESIMLKELEDEFAKKETECVLKVHRQACISLSTVLEPNSAESSVINVLTYGDNSADSKMSSPLAADLRRKQRAIGADEDNYFVDSPNEKMAKLTTYDFNNWLIKIKSFADCYGAAGASLISKVEKSIEGRIDLGESNAPSKVLGIVMNACENHLKSDGDKFLSASSNGNSDLDIDINGIKARILDEYERSKLKADVDKTNANQNSAIRLQNKRSKANKKDFDSSKDEERAFIEEIMGEAVDGLLDEPGEVTMSSVVSIVDQEGSRRIKKGLRALSDITEKDRMMSEERGHQVELIDGLQAQMALRKSNLEERLRKKKQINKLVEIAETKVEIDEDEQSLTKLDLAFNMIKDLVKGAHGSELKNMDLDALLELIDKAMQQEKSRTGCTRDPARDDKTDNPSNQYKEGYEEIIKDIDALLATRRRIDGVDADRDNMRLQHEQYLQSKAKDLSSQYNVEKEKLDLRLKIEQARQQQALQRKLLERRQSNVGHIAPTGGAGYSSSEPVAGVPKSVSKQQQQVSSYPGAPQRLGGSVASTAGAGYSSAAAGGLLAGMMARGALKDPLGKSPTHASSGSTSPDRPGGC